MKTSKFEYRVFVSDKKDFFELKWFDCVTLAEARLVAARYPYARIQCIGEIMYVNGLEKEA